MPKEKNFRSPVVLKLASECPACMYCSEPNVGQVVACHSNQIKHGHGTGIKASDMPIAFMCQLCHSRYDGRLDPNITQVDRNRIFYEASCNTWYWLALSGHLVCK